MAKRLLSGFGLRDGERTAALVGFAALFFTMLGHAALETARDALFLESLPPERLPLVYLGVAAVALAVGRLSYDAKQHFPKLALPATLGGGSLVTLGFWGLLQGGGTEVLFGLYVWVGVFAMAATTLLWLYIGEILNVGQAKRVFGFVGAGGLLGAFAGAAGAAVIIYLSGTTSLLPVAAISFMVAAALSRWLELPEASPPPPPSPPKPAKDKEVSDTDRERRYATRLALSVFVAAVLFTLVDLVFKTTVAVNVDKHELGAYFAKFYAALDLAAVIVQLWLAPRLLRSVGVHWTSAMLPLLLLGSGLGLLAFGGMAAALLGKGADGMLRHGLHKTSTEILYLPLSNLSRARLKTVTEVIAQRAGQAAAAGVSLLATTLGLPLTGAGLLVAGFAAVWLYILRSLEADYLGLFRRHLRLGVVDTEVPDLDLGALEVLIMALSAEDDQEVIGALDWLEAYDKPRLVPPLILLHPSRQVILRSLSFFDEHPSPEALRVSRRRCKDEDPEIRAAIMHFVSRHGDDEQALEAALKDPSPIVRAEGLTLLLAKQRISAEAASEALDEIIENADRRGALVVARAFANLPAGAFSKLACRLAHSHDAEVLKELANALGDNDAPEYVEPLLRLLGRRPSRAPARRALQAHGEAAVEALVRALDRKDLPWTVRRRVPETLVSIAPEDAAVTLPEWLRGQHPDREVRAGVQALVSLRNRSPQVPIDTPTVQGLARHWLERALDFLHAHVAVRCMLEHRREAETAIAKLLIKVLEEKEALALEEAFLLLHVANPRAGFRSMHEALRTGDSRVRASTREVLSHAVPSDLRRGVEALTDDLSDRERLDAATEFHQPRTRARLQQLEPALERGVCSPAPGKSVRRAYQELLDAILEDPSEVLRTLVPLHRAELEAAEPVSSIERSVDLAERAVSSGYAIPEDITHAWR